MVVAEMEAMALHTAARTRWFPASHSHKLLPPHCSIRQKDDEVQHNQTCLLGPLKDTAHTSTQTRTARADNAAVDLACAQNNVEGQMATADSTRTGHEDNASLYA